jgi:hypothetical protein
MVRPNHTPRLADTEEALTVLFCLIDDAYALLNPNGKLYEPLKRLADSEVIALALLQQLRGVESERSVLRDAERFFSHLFPEVVGLYSSSLHRRVRKLRRFLEPLRRELVPELVGEPETLLVDSTLLEVLHPRQVSQSAGFDGAGWVRWGSFSVYGVKLHLLCAPNRVPISYELTPANVADISLSEELINEAALGEEVARKLFGDLAYRSEALTEVGILLATERSERRHGASQHVERSPSRASSGSSAWARRWPPLSCGAGNQDRGQDSGLHLRVLGQPTFGSSSRVHQGTVGMNLTTHI